MGREIKKTQNIRINELFHILGIESLIPFLALLVLTFLLSVLSPYTSVIYKQLIDSISSLVDTQQFLYYLAMYMAVQLGAELIDLFISFCTVRMEISIDYNTTRYINEKLANLNVEVFDDASNNDLIDRIFFSISNEIINCVKTVIALLSPIIKIVMYCTILFSHKWYFPLLVFSANAIDIILLPLQTRLGYRLTVSNSHPNRVADYFSNLLLNRVSTKEIRIFSCKDYFIGKWEGYKSIAYDNTVHHRKRMAVVSILSQLPKTIVFFYCLLITAKMVITGDSTIGAFVLVYSAVQNLSHSCDSLALQATNFFRLSLHLDDIFVLNNLPKESPDTKQLSNIESIVLNNVSYRYPAGTHDAIEGIDLTINAGERLLIVGGNGSGKTTLCNILMGLLNPTNGEMLISGIQVDQCRLQYRSKISCLFQNFIKYQFNIKDNIKLNQEEDTIFPQTTSITKLVDSLPYGYETNLGQLENNSTDLSGGQWQLIAVERLLHRTSVEVLVLDEPSANLDAFREEDVIDSLCQAANNKTLIVVSHHINFAKICDRIVVMSDGKIVEVGSHESLLQQKGLYYELYQAQTTAAISN